MLPVGENRAQGGDERERLVENEVVVGLRDFHDRRIPIEQPVHILGDLGWHEEAQLTTEDRDPQEKSQTQTSCQADKK